ncbi:MAG: hypothetical protein V1755_16130, partial [Chloroflexota bacterium]
MTLVLWEITAFQRLGFFMRAKITVYAALLALGYVVTAWGSPRVLPVPPVQALEAPALVAPGQKPVTLPAPTRGQMLYENHCMSCHESVVYIRGNHRTLSLQALRGQVSHWAGYLQLRWGQEELEE